MGTEEGDAAENGPAPNIRAAETVMRQLESEIVAGKLADGAHLPAERDLMVRFGISRTVVREAIAMLASRGMIESRPRFRPVVRRPGYEAAFAAVGGVVSHLLSLKGGVRNLYNTRIFLEAALVRHAALHARKADIDALGAALEANQNAIPNSEMFYETDVAFHAVFYEIPDNPVFPSVHKSFTAWLSDHWRRMPRSPERNQVNYLSHREIYTAIVERDADGAEKALNAHLNAAWEYVRVTFESA